MTRHSSASLHENHPLKKFFRATAERALEQASILDNDLLFYISGMLTQFTWVENLYKLKGADNKRLKYLTEMLTVTLEVPNSMKKECYQQIGDHTLFMLGFFPESLTYGKRTLSHSYYVDTGRRSYWAVGELEHDTERTAIFRKLADKYERCVLSLNWVRQYSTDPFYQYMLRQFKITE